MKKFVLLLLGCFLCCFFIGCFQPKDDDYFLREFKLENAFVFDNKLEYVVGDTIYFDVNFSRYIKEDGYSNLLDIYETTGAEMFNYSFGFSKYSEFSGYHEQLQIAEKYIFAEKGKISGWHNTIGAVLNEEQTRYESRVGIVLAEAGLFRLENTFNIAPNNVSEGFVYITIQHQFNAVEAGFVEFTVTD